MNSAFIGDTTVNEILPEGGAHETPSEWSSVERSSCSESEDAELEPLNELVAKSGMSHERTLTRIENRINFFRQKFNIDSSSHNQHSSLVDVRDVDFVFSLASMGLLSCCY